MATSFYKTKDEILEEISSDYEEITGEVINPNDLSLEQSLKMHQMAAAMSGFYASLSKAHKDIHPQSSSLDGLIKHLESRSLAERIDKQSSYGKIKHTGVEGTIISTGTRVRRNLDSRLFESIEAGIIDASGECEISYKSVLQGQDNNIADIGQGFTLDSSIANIDSEAENSTEFTNARDQESSGEILGRIEDHDGKQNSGGNAVAYEAWAKEASDQVVEAYTYKQIRGEETVDTVIIAGTSDIDTAVDNDQAITRTPSEELIETVQAYILTQNPTTDNHVTYAPLEEDFDTEIYYELYDESLRSTIDTQITKIWKKYVYAAIPKQRLSPTVLETQIDSLLGDFIKFRRVSNYAGADAPYYVVASRTLLNPNELTLTGGE